MYSVQVLPDRPDPSSSLSVPKFVRKESEFDSDAVPHVPPFCSGCSGNAGTNNPCPQYVFRQFG